MSRFLCRVTRPDGTDSEMTVEAESVATAVDQIVAQKLHITSLVQVDPVALLPTGDLTHDRASLFAEGLSGLLKSGLPLPQALRVLAADASSRRFSRELDGMAAELESGKSLSETMRGRRGHFSPIFVNLVALGEKTGRLPEMMPLLVRHLHLHAAMRRRLFEALLYPGLAILATIGLLLFHRTLVLPQFVGFYASSGIPVPLFSRLAIGFMGYLPWVLVGGAFVIVAGFALARTTSYRTDPVRFALETCLGILPFVGRFRQSAQLANFCSGLGMLLRGSVPAAQALGFVGDLMTTSRGRRAVETLKERCLSGVPLSEAIASLPFFPKALGWIAASGEARGHLPDSLLEAAALFEQEAEYAIVLIQTFLPSMAVVVAAFVLAAVTWGVTLAPLFGLLQALSF